MIIDFSAAPEGATHYNPKARTVFWYKKTRMGFDQLKAGRWTKSHDKQSVIDGLVAIHANDWDGEGLPPVGTVCEGIDGCSRWIKCRIIHHTIQDPPRAMAVWGVDESAGAFFHGYRPILTAEQRAAAEEREKTARELFELVNPEGKWHKFDDNGKARYLAAIDAGFGKELKS